MEHVVGENRRERERKKRITERCNLILWFYDSMSGCGCGGAGGNDSNAVATIRIFLQISNNCQINSFNPYNIKLVLYSILFGAHKQNKRKCERNRWKATVRLRDKVN